MKVVQTGALVVVLLAALVFSVWWYAFVPCSTVARLPVLGKDVPARCLNLKP